MVKIVVRLCFIALSAVVLLSGPVQGDSAIEGYVDAFLDGDTIIIKQTSIRLKGIDAPEMSQTCKSNSGRAYHCGDAALTHLKSLIGQHPLICRGDQKDAYGRLIAYCETNGVDLNSAMVGAGWAVAYTHYEDTYEALEHDARVHKRGIWQGEFTRPAIFRSKSWEKAKTTTSNTSPKNERGECLIKGNINSKGVKIYHTPWRSKHYNRTKINTAKGERWFCSEAEAIDAGWRAPYR